MREHNSLTESNCVVEVQPNPAVGRAKRARWTGLDAARGTKAQSFIVGFNNQHPVVYFDNGYKEQVSWAVSIHLTTLFGKHSKNELVTSPGATELPTYLDNRETDIFLDEEETRFDHFQFYFAAVEIQDFVGFNDFKEPIGVDWPPKFYQTLNMHFVNAPVAMENVLPHFRGKRMFIQDPYYCEGQIVEFAVKWQLREAYSQLEVLEIKTSMGRLTDWPSFQYIMNVMNFDEDEPIIPMEKRPQCSRYPWAMNYKNYIKREDGVIAYILMKHCSLSFYVQDLNH